MTVREILVWAALAGIAGLASARLTTCVVATRDEAPTRAPAIASATTAATAPAPPEVHADMRIHMARSAPPPSVDLGTLTNSLVEASGRSMAERGTSIADCVRDFDFVTDERLAIVAEVAASEDEALVRRWRFDGVLDGQPLSPELEACIRRVLPPAMHVQPPRGLHYAPYEGDVRLAYRIDGSGDPP